MNVVVRLAFFGFADNRSIRKPQIQGEKFVFSRRSPPRPLTATAVVCPNNRQPPTFNVHQEYAKSPNMTMCDSSLLHFKGGKLGQSLTVLGRGVWPLSGSNSWQYSPTARSPTMR